jgi:hypothetical protein
MVEPQIFHRIFGGQPAVKKNPEPKPRTDDDESQDKLVAPLVRSFANLRELSVGWISGGWRIADLNIEPLLPLPLTGLVRLRNQTHTMDKERQLTIEFMW